MDAIFLRLTIRRHCLLSLAISKRFELEGCAWWQSTGNFMKFTKLAYFFKIEAFEVELRHDFVVSTNIFQLENGGVF